MNALQKLAAKKKLTYMLKKAYLTGNSGSTLNPPKINPPKPPQPVFKRNTIPTQKNPVANQKTPRPPLAPPRLPSPVAGAPVASALANR